MSAIDVHDGMVAAFNEQQVRINSRQPEEDIWTGALAARFRDNPHRALDPVLAAIAELLRPEDVLIDVGGGAGRMSLPLALRTREVINIDPSEGMRQEFESVRQEAGISNARFLQSDWLASAPIEGDMVLVGHVTYFVSGIQAFVEKLVRTARRRVAVVVNSTPPPNTNTDLFELFHAEAQARVPGHEQLIPVLWAMGILPEVRVFPPARLGLPGAGVLPSRADAIASVASTPLLRAPPGRLAELAEAHFDTLFEPHNGGWLRRLGADSRPMLITWETSPE